MSVHTAAIRPALGLVLGLVVANYTCFNKSLSGRVHVCILTIYTWPAVCIAPVFLIMSSSKIPPHFKRVVTLPREIEVMEFEYEQDFPLTSSRTSCCFNFQSSLLVCCDYSICRLFLRHILRYIAFYVLTDNGRRV